MPPSRRAVVADDDPLARALVIEALRPLALDIDIAENGRQALQLITTARPDLLVTDRMMPEMDGIALIRNLRARPECSRLPIVMVSSLAGREDVRLAIEAGADAFLPKPLIAEALLARVLGLLGEGA